MIEFIREHTAFGGITSLSTITIGKLLGLNTIKLLPMLIQFLQIFSLSVGIIVGLITIYTFLEKKDFLPSFLKVKNKQDDNLK